MREWLRETSVLLTAASYIMLPAAFVKIDLRKSALHAVCDHWQAWAFDVANADQQAFKLANPLGFANALSSILRY